MKSLLDTLREKGVLLSDGAWGTLLHQRGLQPGECPQIWTITHREDVLAVAKGYIDAGSDLILNNSFGANPVTLEHYGLGESAVEINMAAASISREAAGDDHLVLGSIGPSGKLLMMGEITEDILFEGFRLQAESLKIGGVDAICIETMAALDEACIAIRAAKEATNLEVACTFTFERSANGEYRTIMGVSPEEMVSAVKKAGADVIGTNCGNGVTEMLEIVRIIRQIDTSTPLLVQANAGKPLYENGKTIFPEQPEIMAAKVTELIRSGANIVGGCCGTTPEHIRVLAREIRKQK